jgi:hypothetical protein
MVKTKLTLSIDSRTIKNAKLQSIKMDENLSSLVEEFLNSISGSWISDLAKKLSVKERSISFEDVMKGRPNGLDSGKIIRAMRNGRAKSISR